jgi:hypothetical protein
MRASVEPKHERSVGADFGLALDKIGKEELYISTKYSGRMMKHRPIRTDRPASISPLLHELPVILTESCDVASRRRSRVFHEQAAPPKTAPVI